MFGVDVGSNIGVGVDTLHPPPETTLRLCMRDSEVMIKRKDRLGTTGMLGRVGW